MEIITSLDHLGKRFLINDILQIDYEKIFIFKENEIKTIVCKLIGFNQKDNEIIVDCSSYLNSEIININLSDIKKITNK